MGLELSRHYTLPPSRKRRIWADINVKTLRKNILPLATSILATHHLKFASASADNVHFVLRLPVTFFDSFLKKRCMLL